MNDILNAREMIWISSTSLNLKIIRLLEKTLNESVIKLGDQFRIEDFLSQIVEDDRFQNLPSDFPVFAVGLFIKSAAAVGNVQGIVWVRPATVASVGTTADSTDDLARQEIVLLASIQEGFEFAPLQKFLHQIKVFLADNRWHRTFEPDDFRFMGIDNHLARK
ncbi:MAG: hypothetical protein PHQ83_12170 [Eubacteriales bacterium]|nr:hypothetical protein [Eubacteriales bacterium]